MAVTGFIRHIEACNPPINEVFVPLQIGSDTVGWLRPAVVDYLGQWPEYFAVQGQSLVLAERLDHFQARTQVFQQVVEQMAADTLVNPPINENYPVTADERENALCTVDRVAASIFGLRSFGQHLNAYVVKKDQLFMWIAKRSADRLIFPGFLDNMVAGGLPWGIDMAGNLQKEGIEEANLPPELTAKAVEVGALTYNRVTESGFRPDTLYCYDLEVPEHFYPENTDGEVESFQLLPIQAVYDLVYSTDEFKLNCNLVIIDFLIRHGLIKSDFDGYTELVAGLRPKLEGC